MHKMGEEGGFQKKVFLFRHALDIPKTDPFSSMLFQLYVFTNMDTHYWNQHQQNFIRIPITSHLITECALRYSTHHVPGG